jgi:hypothetical protein
MSKKGPTKNNMIVILLLKYYKVPRVYETLNLGLLTVVYLIKTIPILVQVTGSSMASRRRLSCSVRPVEALILAIT